MAKRSRKDANQDDIVEALESFGCTWQGLTDVGRGCPDGIVGYEGMNLLVEIKMPSKPLRDDQQAWHDAWKGRVIKAEYAEDVIRELTKMKWGLKNG